MAINSLSASSKGLSGLASGIDTESIVEAMLSSTQGKIDAQNQKKTQLGYKQELYRSVITDLQKFQNTYFNFTNSSTNLLSQTFFSTKTANTTSSSYKVAASTSATTGNVTINRITSLASSYKQTAIKKVSAVLSGSIDEVKLQELGDTLTEEKLAFTVGSNSAEISLASLAGKSNLQAESIINDALKAAGVSGSVAYLSGSFTLTADNTADAISVSGSSTALALVGGKAVSGTGSGSFKVDTSAVLPTIKLTVDGVSKNFTFNPLDATSVADQLNTSVTAAFGTGLKVAEDYEGVISFTADNSSRKITISGDADTMEALGIKSGASNKISLTSTLSSNNFSTPVLGDSQKFTINGVGFSFSSNDTIGTIISAINNSSAGVTVSYSSTTDKFSIASNTTGARSEAFSISQSEGNLMTALFGITYSKGASSNTLTKEMTTATLPSTEFSYTGGTASLNVNGTTYAFTMDESYTSATEMVSALNGALLSQFGTDESANPNVAFVISGDNISLQTSDDYSAFVSDNSLSVLGFDPTVTGSTTLTELGMTSGVSFNINGTPLTIDASSSISGMLSSINSAFGKEVATFDESKAYIRIAGVDIPMSFIDYSGKLFGKESGTIATGGSSYYDTAALFEVTEGSDAIIRINGVDVVRSTNSFSVDGLSFTLLSETSEASSISVTQDTDKIYDTVVQFVSDYNTLINSINTLLDAQATYKDYPPLTSAQKEEMTESQISLWEENAKKGLLRNDSTLNTVLASLRRTLYTKPEGSLALYDMGVSTSYFGTKDNLVISDASKLKSLISENPTAVMNLFTNTTSGLSTMLNKAIDDAARTSSSNPGSLVRIAGSTGKTDTSSSIYKQVKEIEESLDRLEDRYSNEYERYWNQFNSMESLITKMNSTSSWLSSMMSY